MTPRNTTGSRSGTATWIWIALVAVLIVGIGGTWLLMRANQAQVGTVEDVDPDTMMERIEEGKQVSVYFYTPT